MPAFVPTGPRGEATGRRWLRGASVVLLLGASWAATWLLGGAGALAPHWYYLPIFATAVWFGAGAVLATALVATVLAGPLTPHDVAAGTAQAASDWVSRGLSFVVVGLLMAMGHRRVAAVHRRQAELERRERELAEQRATVVQSVSHAFRSPLTVISGSVPLLRREELPPEQRAELVDTLQGAATRLEQLACSPSPTPWTRPRRRACRCSPTSGGSSATSLRPAAGTGFRSASG